MTIVGAGELGATDLGTFDAVFLFSPTVPFREAIEAQEGEPARLLYRDLYLQLWQVQRQSEQAPEEQTEG